MLCAVRPAELYRIKEIVKSCDARAFVVVSEAHEVIGEGFELPYLEIPTAPAARNDGKKGQG